MIATCFQVGDRVRARTSRPVPAGTIGRVSMELISVVDMYFVQFDGEHRPTLMHASDLVFVTDDVADEDAS